MIAMPPSGPFEVTLDDAERMVRAIAHRHRRLRTLRSHRAIIDSFLSELEELNLAGEERTSKDLQARLQRASEMLDLRERGAPIWEGRWRTVQKSIDTLFDAQAPILRACARLAKTLTDGFEYDDNDDMSRDEEGDG